MKRQIIGVALAAVAVYMWGFLYWGATTIPYLAWQATNDDAAAGQALLEHFPVSGTYYLPGMYNDEETRNKLSDAGPVGFVHIQREGRPVVDTSTMRNGFLLMLATAFLISVILKRALPALPSYAGRVCRAAWSDSGRDDRLRRRSLVEHSMGLEGLSNFLRLGSLGDRRAGIGKVRAA